MWGNTRTLWGLPYSREECGDFASVQLRGDKESSVVRSIDDKMVEEKKVSFKIMLIFYLLTYFFFPRTIRLWNLLPYEVVSSNTLSLNTTLPHLI